MECQFEDFDHLTSTFHPLGRTSLGEWFSGSCHPTCNSGILVCRIFKVSRFIPVVSLNMFLVSESGPHDQAALLDVF